MTTDVKALKKVKSIPTEETEEIKFNVISSPRYDAKINGYCYLAETDMGSYLKLTEPIVENPAEFQRPRKQVKNILSNPIYQRLIVDIIEGAEAPIPILYSYGSLEHNGHGSHLMLSSGSIGILDGWQRTRCWLIVHRLLEELESSPEA